MRIICDVVTAADVARAVGVVCRRKVVYCSSVGDAASPVWLIAGSFSRQIGQCADWGHNVGVAAEQHGAVLVTGWWAQEYGWVAGIADEDVEGHRDELIRGLKVRTVEGERARAAAAHRRLVESMERLDRERPKREERERRMVAEEAERREQYRPLYEASLAKCRHGGDHREVELAYRMAWTRNYDHDLAHWLRRLTYLAEHGPVETGEAAHV